MPTPILLAQKTLASAAVGFLRCRGLPYFGRWPFQAPVALLFWIAFIRCKREAISRNAYARRYDDTLAQERANHARRNAMQSLIAGGDPIQAALNLSHQGYEAEHQAKQQRQVQMPDEVMNAASNFAYFFHEDVPYPIGLERRPYWEQRGLVFHPNPFHPPIDRVRLRTFWGMRTRKVVTEPVPKRFAHYPQYRDGMWSQVKV